MISSSVEIFKSSLGSYASKSAIIYNPYSVAKNISFLHRMSCQYYRTIFIFLTILQNIPQLTTCVWVQTCCWLIKKNDFWARNKAYCYRQASSHTQRKLLHEYSFLIRQFYFRNSLFDHFIFFFWSNTFNSSVKQYMLFCSKIFPEINKLWTDSNSKPNNINPNHKNQIPQYQSCHPQENTFL